MPSPVVPVSRPATAPVADLLRDIAAEIDRCAARIADGRDPVTSAAAVQALGRLDEALGAVWATLSTEAAARLARRTGGLAPDADDARLDLLVDRLARMRLAIAGLRGAHADLRRTVDLG